MYDKKKKLLENNVEIINDTCILLELLAKWVICGCQRYV